MDPVTLAETVRNVVFTPTQFRAGYDEGAVDDLLDELVDAIEAGSSGSEVAAIASNAQIPMSSMRRGYDCANVDDFLDEVVRQASDSTTDTTARPVTSAPPVTTAPPVAPGSANAPGAERSGLGSRLLRVLRGE